MARFIQDSQGRFAGSIGDGKTDVPTAADHPITAAAVERAVAPDYDAMLAATRAAAAPEQVQSLARQSLGTPVRLVALKHGLAPDQADDLLDAALAGTPQASAAENRPLHPSVAARLVAGLLPAPTLDDAVADAHGRDIEAMTAQYRAGTSTLSEWEAAVLVAVDQGAVDLAARTHAEPSIPALGQGDPSGYVEIPENRRCTLCGQFISLRSGHGSSQCATSRANSQGHDAWTEADQAMDRARSHTVLGRPRASGVLGEPGTPDAFEYTRHPRTALDGYTDDQAGDLWVAGEIRSRRHLIGMLVARDGKNAWEPGPGLRSAMLTWPDPETLPVLLARLDPAPDETEIGHLIDRIGATAENWGRDAQMLGRVLAEPRARAAALDYLADYPLSDRLASQVAEHPELCAIPQETVTRMAGSGSPQVRALAARLPGATIDTLTALAVDPDPGVREALAGSLDNVRRLADANIDALIPLVTEPDPGNAHRVLTSLQRGTWYMGNALTGQHVYLASRMGPARLAEIQAWLREMQESIGSGGGHDPAHQAAYTRITEMIAT